MDMQNSLSPQFRALSYMGLIFGSPGPRHSSCPGLRGHRSCHRPGFPQKPAGSRGFQWRAPRLCGSRAAGRARRVASPACVKHVCFGPYAVPIKQQCHHHIEIQHQDNGHIHVAAEQQGGQGRLQARPVRDREVTIWSMINTV